MNTKRCIICRNPINDIPSRIKIRKACSRSCQTILRNTGRKHPEATINKMRYANAWKFVNDIVHDYLNENTIMFLTRKYHSDKRTIRSVLLSRKIKFRGRKGISAWNKGLKGFMSGEINGMWQGNKAGYHALHQWVSRSKGKPIACEHCGTTSDHTQLQWANIDHTYKRNSNDYISLCPACHTIYDKEHRLR